MRQGLRIALICLASWAQLAAQPSPAWNSAGSMHESRYYHQSVLLESGKLLVFGGQSGCVTGYACSRIGSVEAVATLLALRDRIAPPTLGWAEPEEDLDLDYVPSARPLQVGEGRQALALSNS